MTLEKTHTIILKIPLSAYHRLSALADRRYTTKATITREAVLNHLLAEEKRLLVLDRETKAIFAETGEQAKVTEAADLSHAQTGSG
jgi:predicted transcriptional regulator